MNKIGLIYISIVLTICSCATDIEEMDLAGISMTIKDEEGTEIESLLPDHSYRFDFKVIDSKGTVYQNPNYKDFLFEDLANLEIKMQAAFGIEMSTPIESFHEAGNAPYGFTLHVKNNAFPQKRYEFPLDWENYDTLDFSGDDGSEGVRGKRGRKALGESEDTVTGGRGGSGGAGEDGRNGKGVEILALSYRYGSENKLLLYEMKRDLLFLFEKDEMRIDTTGGAGGRGGSGGPGGAGTDYVDPSDTVTEGSRGSMGRGGEGGDGGDGGGICLLYTDPRVGELISLETDGGRKGYGGNGSPDGRDGENGWNGRKEKRRISRSEAREILRKVTREDFHISQVRF